MKRKRKSKIISQETKGKEFYIMNKDAKFFSGMSRGDVLWSDNVKNAKTFHEPSKINALSRWKPWEKAEIVYK